MTDQTETTDKPNTLMDRRLYVCLDDLFQLSSTYDDVGPDHEDRKLFGASVRLRNCMFNAKIRYVGDLYLYTAPQTEPGEKSLLRIGYFGPKTLNEVKGFIANLGLTLDKQPIGTELWGTLSDSFLETNPVTKDELQQMLRDPSLKTMLPAESRMPTVTAEPSVLNLTPAQKALLPTAQVFEIDDDETIALVDYIKESNGLLADNHGEHIRNPHMPKIATAIVALGGTAPHLIVVESGDLKKPVSAVIAKASAENLALFGNPDPVDVSPDRLRIAIEKAEARPQWFESGFTREMFLIVADPNSLKKIGYDSDAYTKPPEFKLIRRPVGQQNG